MKIQIDNQEYNVIIKKKVATKNMYLRIKDNFDLYVTCNVLVSDREVIRFIEKNEAFVIKNIDNIKKKKEKEESFYYLGKKYDLVYLNNEGITFGETKVFVDENFNLEKWYKQKASEIFQAELDKMYKNFVYEIPYPGLTIRKMKTRWGVCNVNTHRVTLNLELIKKDKIYLDYVIVHELSHLLHHNHGKDFWKCVEDNFKDYKKVRKELKYE